MLRELARIDPANLATILRHHSNVPVRLGDLAKELGVSAVRVSSLKTGVSGQIAREADGYVIRVNRNESRERQRFTIAHELAHYLLHRDIIDRSPHGISDNVLYRSGAPETVEFEANRLGAELIMPSEKVASILANEFNGLITDATIEGLATRFGVSKAAMELQLDKVAKASLSYGTGE